MTDYTHRFVAGLDFPYRPGKLVCVGRNYAEHARELGNAVPESPVLFIKPASAAVVMESPVAVPRDRGACHHELELALLIGAPLGGAAPEETRHAVAGYGLALDLTLRELQQSLKDKGHPWERAKAFDGACPLSRFVAAEDIDWRDLTLKLWHNGELRQQGECRDMLFPVDALLAEISRNFSLQPGDVVLTGTPPGVGPLQPGDQLVAELGDRLRVETEVIAAMQVGCFQGL